LKEEQRADTVVLLIGVRAFERVAALVRRELLGQLQL
jgi:hypothetical protein